VEEKASGSLSAGIGYSQTQGAILSASISQDNFLGSGKRVSAGFDTSQANRRATLAYNNPYYTIDGVSRGFDISYRETDFAELNISSYSTDVSRLGMNFGVPVTEFDRLRFGLAYEHTKFFLGFDASQVVKDFVDENGDVFDDFEFVTSWIRDTRDRAIFPNWGARQLLSMELNLPGSDLQYYRFRYEHSRYFQLVKAFTLRLNLDLGYGDGYGDTDSLPFFRNFYAGGTGTVRGFKGNSLGPKDEFGNALGANSLIAGQMELLFPPPGGEFANTMRFGVFLDAGNVFDLSNDRDIDSDQIRASTGVMLSWISPIGPLSFSVGYPIISEEEDEKEVFQFNIGAGF
jgi:outer membrane protein insertion porin family